MTLYGTRWCGQSASARRFLDKNNVRYHYVDIDENAEGAETVIAAADGNLSVPTLVFPDGRILVEPSLNKIRHALGLEKPAARWWWPF